MKKSVVIGLAFLFCLSFVGKAQAQTEDQNKVVKITIQNDQKTYFLAYIAPDQYIYRVGNEEIKGSKAEKQVQHLLSVLQLTPDLTANQLVARLKSTDFPDLKRLDIRWIDQEDHLYTWIWKGSDAFFR